MTTIHSPADSAPYVTNLYAKCNLCDAQWQIKSPNLDDAKACDFCGVTNEQGGGISIIYEGPSSTGQTFDSVASALSFIRGRR